MFAAPRGIGPYIQQHFLDKTFQGLYHANAFDMALLIPYFVVLILLASYGLHRYVLVYLYYKNKKNHTSEPSGHFDLLPRVTVQLPIFNEQFVVERLLDAISRLQYPLNRLDIQVLDDSTDETIAVARGLVAHYAAQGLPITYHHRCNREGFKAGALAEGLTNKAIARRLAASHFVIDETTAMAIARDNPAETVPGRWRQRPAGPPDGHVARQVENRAARHREFRTVLSTGETMFVHRYRS